jgi:uncharacterized protein
MATDPVALPAFQFGGHDFHIVDGTALYWPIARTLLVADLHLEKGSWFASKGQMLPPYDSQATLERLTRISEAVRPARIIALGDNFHDEDGPRRLQAVATVLLDDLCGRLEMVWITGNHDAVLPQGLGGRITAEVAEAGLVLRHQAEDTELAPELSGHWHPKLRVSGRGRAISRPCFVRSASKLILPAFGALTGGLDARSPELLAAAGQGAEALIAGRGQVLRFGLAR